MKKSKIIVPKGIRYISQWGDFNIPRYPHILNKQIPGCGFTEYCITNQDNVVLCSPRKILLENKRDQHESEVLYINGGTNDDSVSMDKDLSKIKSIYYKKCKYSLHSLVPSGGSSHKNPEYVTLSSQLSYTLQKVNVIGEKW